MKVNGVSLSRSEVAALEAERLRTDLANLATVVERLSKERDDWKSSAIAQADLSVERLNRVAELESQKKALDSAWEDLNDMTMTERDDARDRVAELESALRGVADFSPKHRGPGWCWCGEDEFPEGHFPYCEAARAALSGAAQPRGEPANVEDVLRTICAPKEE